MAVLAGRTTIYGPDVTDTNERWIDLLRADPRPWLLGCDEPFARWVTLRHLLDRPAADAEVRRARAETLAHPAVRGILDTLPDWEQPVRSHAAASYGPNLLHLLADLGLAQPQDGRPGIDVPEAEALLDQMLDHRDSDGRFQAFGTFIRLPDPAWSTLACDHYVITDAMVRWGRGNDPRVRVALDLMARDLIDTSAGPACRCLPHSITGGRGPGRVADPCPQVTVELLRTFARLPLAQRPIGMPEIAQTLLQVWRGRVTAKPYMFGHGVHFKTVKWPAIWYSVLGVLDALGGYPQVWSGPLAAPADTRAAAELVACLVGYTVGADGRVTPQSCYRGFAGFSFSQKKQPSPIATAWVCAVLRRFSALADEAATIDVTALEGSIGGTGQPVPPRRTVTAA